MPNTLTLAVDTANTGTTTDVDFTFHEDSSSKCTFISENHSLVSQDKLDFYRKPNTRSGNYLGNVKVAAKYTKDRTVAGADGSDVVSPSIGEFSLSLPVGMTTAEVLEFRQYFVALADRDDVWNALCGSLTFPNAIS